MGKKAKEHRLMELRCEGRKCGLECGELFTCASDKDSVNRHVVHFEGQLHVLCDFCGEIVRNEKRARRLLSDERERSYE